MPSTEPYGHQRSVMSHMVPCICVNIGSGNGLLPYSTMPLHEPEMYLNVLKKYFGILISFLHGLEQDCSISNWLAMEIPQFCPKSSICSWLRFVCRDPCEMWNWFGILARYWVSILAGDGLELGTRASAATVLMWLCLHAFPLLKRSEMYIHSQALQ